MRLNTSRRVQANSAMDLLKGLFFGLIILICLPQPSFGQNWRPDSGDADEWYNENSTPDAGDGWVIKIAAALGVLAACFVFMESVGEILQGKKRFWDAIAICLQFLMVAGFATGLFSVPLFLILFFMKFF